MRKEYQLKLYKELFPQDTTITENDLELVTLDNVLTIQPYNAPGLLVRGKLIILAEAQSIKSVNFARSHRHLRQTSDESDHCKGHFPSDVFLPVV